MVRDSSTWSGMEDVSWTSLGGESETHISTSLALAALKTLEDDLEVGLTLLCFGRGLTGEKSGCSDLGSLGLPRTACTCDARLATSRLGCRSSLTDQIRKREERPVEWSVRSGTVVGSTHSSCPLDSSGA